EIEEAARAIEPAEKKRIHTFIATSDIHIEKKLTSTREKVMEKAVSAIEKARQYVDEVQFSLEDYTRTDPSFAREIAQAAINAGASIINLPDTVGYAQPDEYAGMIRHTIEGCSPAIWSVHTHNDLGNATANTIAGLRAGARQAEVTLNNIGERAGNAALEEIVANLRTRQIKDNDTILYTNIDPTHITAASKNLEYTTRMKVQPTKAIVGSNAFAHSSGIHQAGVLNDSMTYEIMDPADYGATSRLGHGAQSGKNGARERYRRIGIDLSEDELATANENLKAICDEVRYTDDADFIRALNGKDVSERYKLISEHSVPVEENIGSVIKLQVDDTVMTNYAEGNGPVDAAVNAIKGIINKEYMIKDFTIAAEGNGSNSCGNARAIVTKNGWEVIGIGEHNSIVTSGIEAYIQGCNRLDFIESYFK
ncbi:MAG: alpha-isopropylmalate synthase regulatory domain-containing protein, partial [Candidatus Woesearchaeota archaeon]